MKKNTFKIGKECQLYKLTNDYRGGLWDVISYYAEKLSALDVAINTNIINSKFAFVLGARDKSEAKTLESILDKINRGEPAVIYDKMLERRSPTDPEDPFYLLPIQDLSKNYILDKQLRERQSLINEFCGQIGIPTVPYQKAERMVEAEATSKEVESKSNLITIARCLENSEKAVKKLYPDIKLHAKIKLLEGGESANVSNENNLDRDD